MSTLRALNFLGSWSVLLQDSLFDLPVFRAAVASVLWGKSRVHHFWGGSYAEACDICWLGRVSGVPIFESYANRYVSSLVEDIKRNSYNILPKLFLKSFSAARAKEPYALSGNGTLDIFRDLIVLKEPSDREKGVLLIKYTPTFDAFVSLFDLDVVERNFYVVLEPSWAGYCDPSILMFVSSKQPTFVQCFTDDDYAFIESLKTNLIPIRLGPADWVDPTCFPDRSQMDKKYDVVMVANWGRHKQHKRLFQALQKVRNQTLDILLIGFEWGGRTKDDVLQEASGLPSTVQLHVKENLSYQIVAEHVAQAKVLVFLSKKEGDNKALVEGLFSNVPAIVYSDTVGGARNRINEQTGLLSSFEDLQKNVLYMVDHYQEFSPRDWALRNTGCRLATSVLNSEIEKQVLKNGKPYTSGIVEKANSPNLVYIHPENRERFSLAYASLHQALRAPKEGECKCKCAN